MDQELSRRVEAAESAVSTAVSQWGPLPVAGMMVLTTELRRTTVLLGSTSRAAEQLAIIDWQTAPLAQVFLAHEEGEGYEVPVDERVVAGRLEEKALLTVERGALVRVETPVGVAVRQGSRWVTEPARHLTIPGRPPSARRPYRSPLDVTLDPVQQRAVELPAGSPLLLLGEAGFGKTTVALRRLVGLKAAWRGPRPFKGAVIVPTEGLRRLARLSLAHHGDGDLEALTFDDWARGVAHRFFRGLPRRESVDATSRVIALKRSGALRKVLADFAASRPRGVTGRKDLLHLFGDRAWLEKVVEAAGGRLHAAAVAEVAEHTHVQFSRTTEQAFAHVTDAERLAAVDGRALDDATPMEDAGTIDVEDYPVLVELDRLRESRRRRAARPTGSFDGLVVDEAQELGPLELGMVGRAVAGGGSLVVAGDAAQQVDETADFAGWPAVMESLGTPRFEQVTLEVSYRCPPEVTSLARRVARLRAGEAREPSSGVITWSGHAHPLHAMDWLARGLRAVTTEDPAASVAVICRTAERARQVARQLSAALEVHLALDGDFPFQPGVVVTSVLEVKGLEFDVVVLADAEAATWPDTADARRGLYVALTRTSHRLVLVASGAWSPLLVADREAGVTAHP